MRSWYFVFTILHTLTGLSAQDARIPLPYIRYTVADGLAQMQVRTLFVERNGYVWIGTQGGISGFDGSQIHSYQNPGTLSEGSIPTLVKGSDLIYGTTLSGFFAFDGTNIRIFDQPKRQGLTRVLFQDKNSVVWLQAGTEMFLMDKDTLSNIRSKYPTLASLSIVNAWGDPSWDKCYLLDHQNKFISFDFLSDELDVDDITFKNEDLLGFTSNRSADRSNVIIYRIGQCIDDIYRLVGEHLKHVATRSGEGGPLRQISEHAPKGFAGQGDCVSVLFLLQDSVYRTDAVPQYDHVRFAVESGKKLYVGTDEGLVVVHFDGLENFAFEQCDYAWSIVPFENQLYIGCYKKGAHLISTSGILQKTFLLPDTESSHDAQILSNYLLQDSRILFGGMRGFYYLGNTDDRLQHFFHPHAVEAFSWDSVRQNIVIGSERIYWIDRTFTGKTDSADIPDQILAGARANDLVFSSGNYLWVAAQGGVQRIRLPEKSTQLYVADEGTLPCLGAVTLTMDAEGKIWAGGTCGLMRYNAVDDRFEHLMPELIRKRVNQLALLPGNRMACVSNNDLYLLDISDQNPEVISVYNERNGLRLHEPSENGIAVTGDRYVWLPSVSGIQRLDLNAVQEGFGEAFLKIISVNDRPFTVNPSETIATIDGSSALLTLSVIDHSARDWQYQFSLNHDDFSPWQSARELLVANLRHGSNTIRIRAAWYPSDPESVIESEITLDAHLALLQRSGMQRLLICISLLLLSLVAVVLIRAQRTTQRMRDLRSDLYRNRLRTIQAYLNPHFLFNTLTSIQDRILHQDAHAGNQMIVRLSRVFRKVLDTGKFEDENMPLVRLSDETALVEDIVHLNNIQLSAPVTFTLEIDDSVEEAEIRIPPMLIQPFVENAFKHAFAEDAKQKTVAVHITRNHDFLIIRIQDNGIGIDGSERGDSNSSLGLHLAKERMHILNALGVENSIDVRMVPSGGTLVEIKIREIT